MSDKIEFDEIAEKLATHFGKDGIITLAGFLGSGQEGKVRLYTTEFDEYVEISISDILHQQKLSPAQSAIGGSIVYVKANAHLQWVQSKQTEAQFLSGKITSKFAGSITTGNLTVRNLVHTPINTANKYLCGLSNIRTSCDDWPGCGKQPPGGATTILDNSC